MTSRDANDVIEGSIAGPSAWIRNAGPQQEKFGDFPNRNELIGFLGASFRASALRSRRFGLGAAVSALCLPVRETSRDRKLIVTGKSYELAFMGREKFGLLLSFDPHLEGLLAVRCNSFYIFQFFFQFFLFLNVPHFSIFQFSLIFSLQFSSILFFDFLHFFPSSVLQLLLFGLLEFFLFMFSSIFFLLVFFIFYLTVFAIFYLLLSFFYLSVS